MCSTGRLPAGYRNKWCVATLNCLALLCLALRQSQLRPASETSSFNLIWCLAP